MHFRPYKYLKLANLTDSWPFLVSLQVYSIFSGKYWHLCGGSILNEKVVITAAHCVLKSMAKVPWKNICIFPGLHNSMESNTFAKCYQVKNVETYQKSLKGIEYFYDISLLELWEPFKFNDKVQPIKGLNLNRVEAGTPCKTAGWGQKSDKERTGFTKLQEIAIPVLDEDYCRKFLIEASNMSLTKSSFCAGRPGMTAWHASLFFLIF